MRQNLTNVAETQLDRVDCFYIVGSTTKEGLLDESSNVKIDLKKELAEAGGGEGGGQFNIDDIILADDLLEKCNALNLSVNTSVGTDWTFSDICVQDSAGVLQNAFEARSTSEGNSRGIAIISDEKGLDFDKTKGQMIRVDRDDPNSSYIIMCVAGQYGVLCGEFLQ